MYRVFGLFGVCGAVAILLTGLACTAQSGGRSSDTSIASGDAGLDAVSEGQNDTAAASDAVTPAPDPGPVGVDVTGVKDACKQDPADEANIQQAIDVGYDCFNGGCIGPHKEECLLQCLEDELTTPCAECLVAFMVCTLEDCGSACNNTGGSNECTKCLDNVCNPLFEDCAGLYAPTR